MIKKLWDKYLNLNAPIKMSLWFLICSFLQKGMAMITTPIFTRVMIESEYGRFNMFSSWTNIFTVFVTLNIAGGFFMRGLVVNEDEKDSLTSSMLGLTLTLNLAFLVLYLLFNNVVNNLTGMSTFLTILMFCQMFTSALYSFWINKQRVDYKYKKIVALTFAVTILRPLLSVLFVLKANNTNQVEARIVAMVLVEVLLYSGLFFTIQKRGKCFFKWIYWKDALLFSLPLIPHYLSKIILNQVDKIMIGDYCGLAEVGYYSVAYSLAYVVHIFNSSVTSSLDPWIYKSIKSRNLSNIRKVTMKILVMMGVINIAIVSVAPEILRILAPGNYYKAVWVIPPITASVFFMFMYDLFASFQYYYKKTRWIMTASIVGAVLDVVLNWIFIPKYGFIAAGYTTLVCYIVYGLLHYYFMRKVCKEYLDNYKVYNLRSILLLGAILLLFDAFIMSLYEHIVIRYIILISICIIAFLMKNRIKTTLREIKK